MLLMSLGSGPRLSLQDPAADSAADSTADSAADSTADSTADPTTDSTADSTADSAADSTADSGNNWVWGWVHERGGDIMRGNLFGLHVENVFQIDVVKNLQKMFLPKFDREILRNPRRILGIRQTCRAVRSGSTDLRRSWILQF